MRSAPILPSGLQKETEPPRLCCLGVGRSLVATCWVAGALRGACRSCTEMPDWAIPPSQPSLPVPKERADSQRRNHLGKIGPRKPCLPAPQGLVCEALGGCCPVAKSCQLFATSSTVAHQAPPSCAISRSLLEFMSIESVMLSNRLILCCPLLLLPLIFPSIRVFSSESVLHISCWEGGVFVPRGLLVTLPRLFFTCLQTLCSWGPLLLCCSLSLECSFLPPGAPGSSAVLLSGET